MLGRINESRATRGLGALRPSGELDRAAARHAADLSRNAWLTAPGADSHAGSDGSTAWGRAVDAGYRGQFVREMTGWGFNGDYDRMMSYWLASPVHNPIIYDPALNEIGTVYLPAPGSEWGHYWVVLLGRGAGVVTPPPAPPGDHVVYAPVVSAPKPSGAFDLLAYLRGDGRAYRVGNAGGSFEVFQTQVEGDRFYQIKAWDDLSRVNWEEFIVEGDIICRDVDTSPGGDRFYRQFGAPWVRRWMRPGETFQQGKRLQFYNFNCEEIDPHLSGHVVDSIRFVAHYPRYTFPARDWAAVTLEDVVELEWLEGGEVYHFAKGFGLAGWSRRHQDPHSPVWTAISEMRPGVGRLERLRVCGF